MLHAFFEPVSKQLLKGIPKKESWMGNRLQVNTGKFPDTSKVDVAIIGLGPNADTVRKQLYKYSHKLNGIEVADFGNLRHNGTDKNINAGLAECLLAMKDENIIPVIIGEQANYGQAFLKGIAFEKIDVAMVSPTLAFSPTDLTHMLSEKNKLFHASFIAFQSYLNTGETMQDCSEVFSEYLRLGNLRADLTLVEPLLRQADIFDFDLSAIRFSEFRSAATTLPNGLSNHEACAVCRYAGISNTVSHYMLRNFTLNENDTIDAQQVAQMVWYILDGIDNRFNDFPQMNHRNFSVYKCHATNGIDMVFLNSNLTGRWWMQIPDKAKGKKLPPKFIGCTESDFEIAREGDVPEKWFRASGSDF